jgi:hypothetical protein
MITVPNKVADLITNSLRIVGQNTFVQVTFADGTSYIGRLASAGDGLKFIASDRSARISAGKITAITVSEFYAQAFVLSAEDNNPPEKVAKTIRSTANTFISHSARQISGSVPILDGRYTGERFSTSLEALKFLATEHSGVAIELELISSSSDTYRKQIVVSQIVEGTNGAITINDGNSQSIHFEADKIRTISVLARSDDQLHQIIPGTKVRLNYDVVGYKPHPSNQTIEPLRDGAPALKTFKSISAIFVGHSVANEKVADGRNRYDIPLVCFDIQPDNPRARSLVMVPTSAVRALQVVGEPTSLGDDNVIENLAQRIPVWTRAAAGSTQASVPERTAPKGKKLN